MNRVMSGALLVWSLQARGVPTSPAIAPTPVVPPRQAGAQALVLSDQAKRFLALQYRSFRTEFLGCMIGEVRGGVVLVQRIAPADVAPARSTATGVVPSETCEEAGWTGTVGMIHSHPTGERCWYYFPGTQVPTSDEQSFVRRPYLVDAIMCGDTVVWINRDLAERQLALAEGGDRLSAAGGAR
jgi:hypothetical protein